MSGSSIPSLSSFTPGGTAAVIGATGAIGAEVAGALQASGCFSAVLRLSRSGAGGIALDLTDEASIAGAAARTAVEAGDAPLRLVFDATGLLHEDNIQPEKSWRQIDPASMARILAINTIGPALLMKHFLPLLAPQGKAVFATLSARVGSIGDNHLGGWYSYRAAKAALNQLVRCASIELARKRPESLCIALHPGTVESRLSGPFARSGLTIRTPREAAGLLLQTIDGLTAGQTGSFHDAEGKEIVW